MGSTAASSALLHRRKPSLPKRPALRRAGGGLDGVKCLHSRAVQHPAPAFHLPHLRRLEKPTALRTVSSAYLHRHPGPRYVSTQSTWASLPSCPPSPPSAVDTLS